MKVTSGREEYSKIPPEQLLIKVPSDVAADDEITVGTIDLREGGGKFSPKVQNSVEKQLLISINSTL